MLVFLDGHLCVFPLWQAQQIYRDPHPSRRVPRQHANGCYILVIASLLTNGCEVSWGHYLSVLLLFLIEFHPSVVSAALCLTSRTSRCKLSPRTTFTCLCSRPLTRLWDSYMRVLMCRLIVIYISMYVWVSKQYPGGETCKQVALNYIYIKKERE